MSSVLVTGGTGFVGKHLCQRLNEQGYDVKILSRQKNSTSRYKTYYWNPYQKEIEKGALENLDHIIHLAGANISEKRWSKKRKQQIISSRVGSAKFLHDSISAQNLKLKSFITSSAIGYYGSTTSEKIFSETDTAATDFLGETCVQWEKAADLFIEEGIRTVKVRTGLTLAKEGPLSKIMIPVKLGFGSPVGSGLQYMPWIHIEDLCNFYIMALEDSELNGPFNLVAPDHKTNQQFTKLLALVLKKRLWFPNIPSFVLQALLGEMSLIALNGSKVSSEKIIQAGFRFKFPSLEKAFEDIYKV